MGLLPKPVGRQRDVVYMPAEGHHVVLGTAGTGKTVMAIHRAVHLTSPSTAGHGPTLLLTFTKSLTSYLDHLAAGHRTQLTVENYHRFARGYLAAQGRMGPNAIVENQTRRELIEQAVSEVAEGYKPSSLFNRPAEFFDDELDWIEGQGLRTLEEYLAVKRVGRMSPLQVPTRTAIWKIRARFLDHLGAVGKRYTWSGLPSAVREALNADGTARRYRHIVIDEGQDLSPEAIRSCAEALQEGGSLTLFCDYAQQIYGQRISWTSCGLTIAKAELFTDNYRNTPEIAKLALAMASMPHFRDSADLVVPRIPVRAASAKPTLVRCSNSVEEALVVRRLAADLGMTSRVVILTPTRSQARQACQGITGVKMLHDRNTHWDDEPGVFAGTYYSGKGLEFDIVLLPFSGSDQIPDPSTVSAFGEEEAAARESRLLYVGVTRAKRELVITYSGTLTPLLPASDSGLYALAI